MLVDLAEKPPADNQLLTAQLNSRTPREVPEYALREYLSGRIQIICSAHNALLSAESVQEAVLAISKVGGFAARKNFGKITELMSALNALWTQNQALTPEEAKREILQDLKLQAAKRWARAKRPDPLGYVQHLTCLNGKGLALDSTSGAIRGPNDSFTCDPAERCAAALYMYGKTAELGKVCDALHPNKLDAAAAAKQENSGRRKTLKSLIADGPDKFNKGRCRGLGDAYFAVMCPAGSDVLTSNTVDHAILCNAVGLKAVKAP